MQFRSQFARGVRGHARMMLMVSSLAAGASCKRDPAPAEGAPAVSGAASSNAAASARAGSSAAPVPLGAWSASPTTPEPLGAPPDSFSSGEKVQVANAVGLGCEARSSQGWLELLCRKKNGTGGHPVRAIRDLDAFNAEQAAGADAAPSENGEANDAPPSEAADTAESEAVGAAAPAAGEPATELANVVLPDEQGQLRVRVPWRAGQSTKVRVEWSDTSYDLESDGTTARLVLPVSVALRRQCEAVRKQSQAPVDAAGKNSEGSGLSVADVGKLPRFGICQNAGLGAWALELQKLEAAGAAATRVVRATFAVAHVDPGGQVKRAEFGTLAFAPQGLQAKPLMVYDYDDDGQQELIVRYDVLNTTEVPPKLPAVFTVRGGEVVAYDKLDPMGPGAVVVEQLDYDMRPDVADFGPYVAWLSDDCGAKVCPDRISGPLFFAYAQKDGSFSRSHDAALGALKRACPKAPDAVVVTQGDGVNAARTAQQLACAKVWKVDDAKLSTALETDRKKLCSGAEDCSLYRTLKGWVGSAPPASL